MRNLIAILVLLTVTFAGSACAQNVMDDILALAQKNVGEEVMLAYVAASNSTIELSATDIIKLRDAKVPDKVVVAMLRHHPTAAQVSQPQTAKENKPEQPVIVKRNQESNPPSDNPVVIERRSPPPEQVVVNQPPPVVYNPPPVVYDAYPSVIYDGYYYPYCYPGVCLSLGFGFGGYWGGYHGHWGGGGGHWGSGGHWGGGGHR